MNNLIWQRFNQSKENLGNSWLLTSGQNAPSTFTLLLCNGVVTADSTFLDILANEVPVANGYNRKSVSFEEYDSNLDAWVSENVVFSASGGEIAYKNVVLVADTVPISSKIVTSMTASTDTITAVGHGLSTGNTVIFSGDGSMPYPLQKNVIYYVEVIDADNFKVAYSDGGTAIDLTTDSSGVITMKSASGNPDIFANLSVTDTIKDGDTRVVRVTWKI